MAVTPDYDKSRFVAELAEELLARNSKLSLIDFYIGPGERLHVMGTEIKKIGNLIQKGKVRIAVDDAYLKANGADAAYNGKNDSKEKNRIVVPTDWIRTEEQHRRDLETARKYSYKVAVDSTYNVFVATPMNKARLVHEATHALIDQRGINVYAVRNEVAAWLAGVIYLYHIGGISSAITDNEHFQSKLWAAAHEVASKQKLYLKKGVRLYRPDLQPLLRSVQEDYGLPWHERSGVDGID